WRDGREPCPGGRGWRTSRVEVGFRLSRRVRLFPGVSVNLSRSGPSLSVGVGGAHLAVGKRGVTRTVGVPGTGIFYTSRAGTQSGLHNATPPVDMRPAPAGAGLVLAVAIGVLA